MRWIRIDGNGKAEQYIHFDVGFRQVGVDAGYWMPNDMPSALSSIDFLGHVLGDSYWTKSHFGHFSQVSYTPFQAIQTRLVGHCEGRDIYCLQTSKLPGSVSSRCCHRCKFTQLKADAGGDP